MTSRLPRRAFTLIELLVVIGIMAVIFGLVLAGVQHARAAAARVNCANNLKQIGLAAHQYHETYRAFPPGISYRGGADDYPFLGWSARLLPYLEHQASWNLAVEAYTKDKLFWNPPHDAVRAQRISTFSCPADSRVSESHPVTVGRAYVGLTSYLGVEGLDQHSRDGMVFLDSAIRLAEVTDGSSNTLLVGERPPSSDLNFGWWYAGWGLSKDGTADLTLGVRPKSVGPKVGTCPEQFNRFRRGSVNDRCATLHFWSLHSGGATFVFVDGSVRFLMYSAEPIMAALASRAGGESVGVPD